MDLLLFLSMFSLSEEDDIHVMEGETHKGNMGFFLFLVVLASNVFSVMWT